MKKTFALIAALVLGAALSACSPQANAADWDFVGAGYTQSQTHGVQADAVSLEASKAVGDHFFVQGVLTEGRDQDYASTNVRVSVGAHSQLSTKTDLYGKLSSDVIVADRGDLDKYGLTAEIGARHMVTDRLELRGGVIAGNLRENRLNQVEWMATAGAEYRLTKSLRLGLDMRGKDQVLEGTVVGRVYF